MVAISVSLAFGWGVLGDRWLAFLPVGFLAFGDNAAGITRATIFSDAASSLWPSATMLLVCLIVALLLQPYWVGVVGAVSATAVERLRPLWFWDDNLPVVISSAALMAGLLAILGNLG